MNRYTYFLSFALLYIAFSLIIIKMCDLNKIHFIIGNRTYKKNKQKFFSSQILTTAVFILVSSIRMNTGSDYWSYWMIYNRALTNYGNASDVIADRGTSSGLYLIAYFLKKMMVNFNLDENIEQNILFIVVSVFVTVMTIHQIKKYSTNFKWSISLYLLLGFYMISNNILKQQISMSIMIYAFFGLREKKIVKYILLCLLACFFHTTAVFPALLFPIIIRIKYSKTELYMGLLILGAIGIAIPYLEPVFSVMKVFGFQDKYFTELMFFSSDWRRILYVILDLFMYIMLFIFLYKKKQILAERSIQTYSIIALILMGIMFNALALRFWLIVRVSLYFYQFAIFAIPNAIEICKPSRRELKWLKIALVVYAFLYVITSGDNHYYAYHTIFNQDMEPAYLYNYIEWYE